MDGIRRALPYCSSRMRSRLAKTLHICAAYALLALLLGVAPTVFAQSNPGTDVAGIGPGGGAGPSPGGIDPWVEYHDRVHATEAIAPLDNGFAGEHVSLYDGATTFLVTDIDVPGNFALPVQLARRFNVALQPQDNNQYDARLLGAGNWDVDVPYVAATYPTSSGWPVAQQCQMGIVPPPSMGPNHAFYRSDVWQGITIHVPGRGDASALGMGPDVEPQPAPASGVHYILTTQQRDMLSCIPMQSGFPGDGFRMTTAAGVTYYFNVGTTRTAARLHTLTYWDDSDPAPAPVVLPRTRYYLLASKIEDRFGNTVQYQYDANGHPTRIWSSDGRSITLAYTGGHLSSATSNGRAWQYQYDAAGKLAAVVRPDGSRWQYAYSGGLKPSPPPPYESLSLLWCQREPAGIGDEFTLTATGPSGAAATFVFDNIRHFRSGVAANECEQVGNPVAPTYELLVPNYFDVMSLARKTISGPAVPSATWTYEYASDALHAGLWGDHTQPFTYPCPDCTKYKTVTVTNPDGTSQQYRYGMEYHFNDGRLLQKQTLDTHGNVVRTTQYQYMTDREAANEPFYGPDGARYGAILGNNTSDPVTALIRPVTQTVITQDSAAFTTTTDSFDNFARATSETESSNVGPGYSKTASTAYADDLNRWVLGMVTSEATNGIVSSQTDYDSLDRPINHYAFGIRVATDAWNADGTLASVADGNGNATGFSNWYRGLPQHVTFADGTGESATVNTDGWITAVTDAAGNTTNYAYDSMGRLASITYPGGDDVAWSQTLLSFAQVNGTEFGIPAGHWKQTIHTGNGYAITYFDAMWRPVVSEHYDSGNEAGTLSEVVHLYDAAGRKVFTSYPTRSATSYTQSLPGVATAYDALGRVTEVDQDSELGATPLKTTTQYLPGFQTQTTDPRGFSTLTTYQAWGQPTTKYPDSVTAPAGELTVILRDVFGKPTSITLTGTAAGSQQLTRYYVYNGYQQLCKRIDPESGATAFGYDAAGNLAWSAAGLTLTGTTTCDASAAYASGRRADRTYDTRNRVTALTFPDGNGNQTWTYTPDGQPSTITRQNDNGGITSVLVTSSYLYDKRGLLVSEALNQNGSTWSVGYGHDANGHLASETYPNGLTIPFAPNALGQPTEAGSYATGAGYYPDGKVSQFSYGNGIVHSLTENARGLPAAITDSGAGVTPLQQTYTYDADGNPTAISDAANSAQNRSMLYDDVDRLVSATVGYQGTTPTTFSYDVLDNLTAISQGSHLKTLTYNAAGQLSALIDSAAGTTAFTYDAQGNLAAKGGQIYAFDYGNRLRWATGRESYAYDALGRRVMATASSGGASILSLYSHAGQLLYQQDNRSAISHAYVYLGGKLVATVDYPFAGGNSTRYEHSDAQGSVVAETNASRVITKTSVYASWGALLNHGNDDAPGYTGHLQDSLTDLTYMQQRYYDPSVGRFLSMDPVGVNATTGGNFNRYWYAADNPARYVDSNGLCPGSLLKDCSYVTSPVTIIGAAGSTAGGNAGKSESSTLSSQSIGWAGGQDQRYDHAYKLTRGICYVRLRGCQYGPVMTIANPTSAPSRTPIHEGINVLSSLIPFHASDNPIYHHVDWQAHTITNTTLPGHVFQGSVTTTFYIVSDRMYMTTVGVGSSTSWANSRANEAVGIAFFGLWQASVVKEVNAQIRANYGIP